MKTAMLNSNSLKEFIEGEMRRRDMSARQFAEFVGVAHTTINRAIDPSEATTPSPDFLVKLARATKINLSSLIALIMPEVETTRVDARSQMLAERIAQLPADKREIAEAFRRRARIAASARRCASSRRATISTIACAR